MKRIAILLAVVAMLASTATIALADDADLDIDPDEGTNEERELNETQQRRARLLAKFQLSDYPGDGKTVDEPTPDELLAAQQELDEAAKAIAVLRTGESEVGVVGWGAIFKLIQLYKLRVEGEDGEADLTFATMLEEFGVEGWAFGKHFKVYRDELRENSDGAPKNLGQLKKQNREAKPNHAKKPKKS